MRCLLVVPSLRRAGAERQTVDLANGMVARGHHVSLCILEQEACQFRDLSDAVSFYQLNRKGRFDLGPVAGIARVIERERIEVVQGIMQFSALFCAAASLRSSLKPPVVAAIHTTKNLGVKEEIQDRLLYRHMLCRFPANIFVCNHQRDYWISKYPELTCTARVVHNGIDVGKFERPPFVGAGAALRGRLFISPDEFVFTCIAGFRREKGHDVLIHAFASMPHQTHLILAGDGPERKNIERVVQSLRLEKRVHFLGVVHDVRPVLAASDVTVLASTAVETFSIAMLESMAMKVPMIASDIGGLAEAIMPGKTGLLSVPGDVASLQFYMELAIANRSKVVEMGRAGSALVRSRFTIDRMVEAHIEILTDVIHGRRD